MNNIIVSFTRHTMSEDQKAAMLSEVDVSSEDELRVFDLSEMASNQINSLEDAAEILSSILELGGNDKTPTIHLFGVIPPILRNALFQAAEHGDKTKDSAILCVYEAHNKNRSKEGEKPTFEFDRWFMTAIYSLQKEALSIFTEPVGDINYGS